MLEVSQCVDLGRDEGEGCFHSSENESAGPGEKKIIWSLILQMESSV